ncbi:MAG: hypothetical protein CMJ25_25940 [Phycisphaerae bacterium]|nr:hypothetical protein [Phycisphaerae bacterium]
MFNDNIKQNQNDRKGKYIMTNTTLETAFNRALGNGVNLGETFNQLIKNVVTGKSKGDTTSIVNVIAMANKKGDKIEQRIKRVFGLVFEGATFKTEKNKKTGKTTSKMIIKGIKPNQKVLDILDKLVDDKVSMRGDKFMQALIGKPAKKSSPLNVKSFIDTCSKRSTDELKEMQKIIKAAIKHQEKNVVVELPNKKAA